MSTDTTEAPPTRDRPLSWQNLGRTIAGGYVPLILATLVVFVPLLWMMLSSLKAPGGEIVTTNLTLLPKDPNLQNYADAASTVPFARFFLNSVIVTVVGSTIKCILAVFTAYALVFVRFPFKRVIFLLILVALMVPPQVSVLPNYVLIAGMGGLNTYWGGSSFPASEPPSAPSSCGSTSLPCLRQSWSQRKSTARDTGESSGRLLCPCRCQASRPLLW